MARGGLSRDPGPLIPSLLPRGEGRVDPSSLRSGEREGVRDGGCDREGHAGKCGAASRSGVASKHKTLGTCSALRGRRVRGNCARQSILPMKTYQLLPLTPTLSPLTRGEGGFLRPLLVPCPTNSRLIPFALSGSKGERKLLVRRPFMLRQAQHERPLYCRELAGQHTSSPADHVLSGRPPPSVRRSELYSMKFERYLFSDAAVTGPYDAPLTSVTPQVRP